jgi:NADH:quinone reductase (non-electrogenic)
MSKRASIPAIVGGGFAGLSVAKGLRKSPVEIVLIGQANHHLFQSLLYQVATWVLTTGQIAVPIREISRGHKDTRTQG